MLNNPGALVLFQKAYAIIFETNCIEEIFYAHSAHYLSSDY